MRVSRTSIGTLCVVLLLPGCTATTGEVVFASLLALAILAVVVALIVALVAIAIDEVGVRRDRKQRRKHR